MGKRLGILCLCISLHACGCRIWPTEVDSGGSIVVDAGAEQDSGFVDLDSGQEPTPVRPEIPQWACDPVPSRTVRVKGWRVYSGYRGAFSAINSSGVIAGRAYFDGGARANAFLHLGDAGAILLNDENVPVFLTDTGSVAFLNGRGVRIATLDGGFSAERRPSKVVALTDHFRVGIEDWYSLVVSSNGAPERRSAPVLVNGVTTAIRASAISADGEIVGGTLPTGSSALPVAWLSDGGYHLLASTGYAYMLSISPPHGYGWTGSSLTIWCLGGGAVHSSSVEGSIVSGAEAGGVVILNVVVGSGASARWRSIAWSGGPFLDIGASVDGGFERVFLTDIDENLLAVGEARTADKVTPIVVQLEY